jgi:hypothetical protein
VRDSTLVRQDRPQPRVRAAACLRYKAGAMPQGLLRRPDLLADQRLRSPFGHRRFAADDPPVRAGITGSGSDLLLLVWSATDLAGEIEAGVRVLGRLGVGAGTRVANTLPGALETPGALLLGDVDEALGALDVPLGTVETEAAARAAWELVDRVQCEVLVLEPATAATLFAAASAEPRPWLRGIVWLVRADGPALPPAPGFGGWQRSWLAVPEVASFVAGSCEAGRLHVDVGVEAAVIDRELVLTPRGPAAAPGPLATGIAARLEPSCACGVAGPALELARAPLVAPPPMR